jgi:accessory gene regulator B
MSRNIASFFASRGIISQDDIEVYAYSFEILISSVASFIALTVIAIISRTAFLSALYLLGFVPLRLLAGGYHAKSHFRCFLLLMITYSVFLLLISLLPASNEAPSMIISAISVVLVIFLAPRPDENKPIADDEAARFKKLSRAVVVFYAVAICMVSVLVPDNRIGFSLALGVFTASAALLASYIKTAFQRKKANSIGKEGEIYE